MKKIIFTILVVGLSLVVADAQNSRPANASAVNDISPESNRSQISSANGDYLYTIDVETITGDFRCLGVEHDTSDWWVTGGADMYGAYLYQINHAGTILINTYAQGNTSWGWRDLGFDGVYLYASDSYFIEQIDPTTGSPTGVTIPSPTSPARAMAYDPVTDSFWTANFSSSIYNIDRGGNYTTFANPSGLSIYGMAMDDINDILWVWSQDASGALASAFDPRTGSFTGESWDGGTAPYFGFAGGCCIYDDPVWGYVFAGMHQSTTDNIAIYSLLPFIFKIHGSMAAYQEDDIMDYQLDDLLSRYIKEYHSRILVFGQCFCGDFIDDFQGDRATTILTSQPACLPTWVNAHHRGLAKNLGMAKDTQKTIENSDKFRKRITIAGQEIVLEDPQHIGPTQQVGTGGEIKSTHVLVWAGKYKNAKEKKAYKRDIADIRENFKKHQYADVKVLFHDGKEPEADAPATFKELVDALDEIKAKMNKDEQFVMFVSDHGDKYLSIDGLGCFPYSVYSLDLDLPSSLWDDMMNDQDNVPYLALFTTGPTRIGPGELEVWLNSLGPLDVGSGFREVALDYDNDLVPDQYEYCYDLTESNLHAGINVLQLQTASVGIDLAHAGLDSGALGMKIAFLLFEDPYPLQSGQNASFTVTDSSPNTATYLAYSTTGASSTYIPLLDAFLYLANPTQAGSVMTTNAQGNAVWNLPIPAAAAGRTVWLQAVQYGDMSNLVESLIL